MSKKINNKQIDFHFKNTVVPAPLVPVYRTYEHEDIEEV